MRKKIYRWCVAILAFLLLGGLEMNNQSSPWVWWVLGCCGVSMFFTEVLPDLQESARAKRAEKFHPQWWGKGV
jgi:hypothetical protein